MEKQTIESTDFPDITVEQSAYSDTGEIFYIVKQVGIGEKMSHIALCQSAALKLAAIITEQCEPPKPVERPILDWLNEIEDQIVRAQAVANYDVCLSKTGNAISQSQAINDGIEWICTRQGFEYWQHIYDQLIKQGK